MKHSGKIPVEYKRIIRKMNRLILGAGGVPATEQTEALANIINGQIKKDSNKLISSQLTDLYSKLFLDIRIHKFYIWYQTSVL